MLDLNQLIEKQNQGNLSLATLSENEETIMQNYCVMSAQGILGMTGRKGEPLENAVLNAFRNGICLGLAIDVDKGQIKGRSNK